VVATVRRTSCPTGERYSSGKIRPSVAARPHAPRLGSHAPTSSRVRSPCGPDGKHDNQLGPGRIFTSCPFDELIELAKHRVTRSLRDDECRQYLHTGRCSDSA
jgi:hypothetical protein